MTTEKDRQEQSAQCSEVLDLATVAARVDHMRDFAFSEDQQTIDDFDALIAEVERLRAQVDATKAVRARVVEMAGTPCAPTFRLTLGEIAEALWFAVGPST